MANIVLTVNGQKTFLSDGSANQAAVTDGSGNITFGYTDRIADNTTYVDVSDTTDDIEFYTNGTLLASLLDDGGLEIGPYNTATGNTGTIKLKELTANGDHGTLLRAADSMVADVTYTFPSTGPTADGQVLAASQGASSTLSWDYPWRIQDSDGDTFVRVDNFFSDNDVVQLASAGTIAAEVSLTDGLSLLQRGTSAGETGQLRFRELAAGGSDFITFKAPDALTAYTVVWPDTGPASDGQVMAFNTDGTTSFSSTGGAVTMQAAYEGGATVAVTTAEGSPTISNSADSTDLLTLDRSFAGAGNGIDLTMGATTTEAGIDITMTSGATGAGVNVTVAGAFNSGLTVTDGTDSTLVTPSVVGFDNEGGSSSISGLAATTAATAGTSITIAPGNGNTSGAGGTLNANAGDGGTTGVGGPITIQAGDGGSTSGDGGSLTVTGGAATSGDGGAITHLAGNGGGAGTGGAASYTAGNGGATGTGGALTLTSGQGGATSGASGAVALSSGNAPSGAAGDVSVDTGTGTGSAATVSVGYSNADLVTLGRGGGALSLVELPFQSGHPQFHPYGTSTGETGGLELRELLANGTNGVIIKAADSLAATDTYTWPNAVPAASGYVLSSTTAGVMSWVASGGGSSTEILDADGDTGVEADRGATDADTVRIKSAGEDIINVKSNSGLLVLPHDAGTTAGTISLREAGGGIHSISLRAPASVTADVVYILPDLDGSNGEVLGTDGSGNLDWINPSGATLAAGQYFPTLTDVNGTLSNMSTTVAMYSRVNTVVTATMWLRFDYDTNFGHGIRATLPVASAMTGNDLTGSWSTSDNTISGFILPDTTNDEFQFNWNSDGTARSNLHFQVTFQYLII